MNKTSEAVVKARSTSAVSRSSIFVRMDPQGTFFLHTCYMPFTNEMQDLLWNIWLLGQGTTFLYFSSNCIWIKDTHPVQYQLSDKILKASHTYTCTTSIIYVHQPCTGEAFSFFLTTEPLLLWILINPQMTYLQILCIYFRGACLLYLTGLEVQGISAKYFLSHFSPGCSFLKLHIKLFIKQSENIPWNSLFLTFATPFIFCSSFGYCLSPAYAYAHIQKGAKEVSLGLGKLGFLLVSYYSVESILLVLPV